MTDAPITLWHASRADIERPTIAGRTEGDHHANSGLGIYCATGPHSYIAGFGGDVHALEMRSDTRIMDMSVEELRRMGDEREGARDRDWFDAQGRRLAQDHDVIMLREDNGLSTQAIILNDEAVASSRRMDATAFKEIAYDVWRDVQEHERSARKAYDTVRPRGPSRMQAVNTVGRSRGR